MKIFVAVFMSSAAFAAAISIVYWFASHEYGGALLLGLMALALTFLSTYAFLSEKNAGLVGDNEQLQHKQAAGEDLGVFTTHTPWSPLLALSILWFFIGLVWSDFMIFTGAIAILLTIWRLGAESARV